MGESLKGMKRTHYCGDIREADIGQTVTVMGWVNKRRDMSHLFFIVVRDRTGIVQVVVDEQRDAERYALAKAIRGEYVVAATGVVIPRTPENVNPDMPTGGIEIEVQELRVLSEAEVPPFQVASEDVALDMRLKYRYIDLRRPEMQKIFQVRHKTAQSVRRYLSEEGFLELETPMLINSSPEGARDYLVPSRMHPGQFYALPQSPQQMKQVLMFSGFDKYFQIARCFRDEDLRADRQPEFTQIDIEMSFVEENDVLAMAEGLMARVFKDVLNVEIPKEFPRMTYHEAMERFGSDKPDTRFGMELCDISDLVRGCDFQVFSSALENGGSVRGINAAGCSAMPRKQIDAFVELARTHKAKGLAWIVLAEDGSVRSTLQKFFSEEQLKEICQKFGGKPGDLIFLCADTNAIVFEALGAVRLAAAKWKKIIPEGYEFLWVTHFPLLEYSPEDERYFAAHHPFTSPLEEDLHLLEADPAATRARAYDLVLNGVELGGGSIRIHQKAMQDRMFAALGFTPESAEEGFGYFLEALKYGVPPHGGIALGFDRVIMLMTDAESLREVILFPKVKDASCPMTHAPNTVAPAQLEETGIMLLPKNSDE
ncbi:MAG: aspartate--tRNA ligase [Defluviitaleaceae bacterium]|nr:aspartate--tRNA ligase [Defluviitaleaceae bacterium]